MTENLTANALYRNDRKKFVVDGREWYSAPGFISLNLIDEIHDNITISKTNPEGHVIITGLDAVLSANLQPNTAYWVNELTDKDGWCVYNINGEISLQANVDVWTDRPDCGFRPVITVDKQCIN